VKFLGGMSPWEFFKRSRGTMVTAFSTSSSSATLPTAMKCAEEELNVPPTVSRFVLPLSASMNHNGTALFESVTVLFLAQAFGVQLDIGQQLVVLVLCILTATGMAGVPGGSLPLIGLILVQVNVEAGAIALVLGVDRILDMCRTMVNVTADLTTAIFVARSEPAVESNLEPPAKPQEGTVSSQSTAE
jgi:DAACS family dicarboxylate/amino acid:cation (Na+ or H+) symporter